LTFRTKTDGSAETYASVKLSLIYVALCIVDEMTKFALKF